MAHPFRHEALTYSGPDEFLSHCHSLVADARSGGERVVIFAASGKLALLRAELGQGADDVTLVATEEQLRNPARITTLLDGFRAEAGGQRCVGVNEPLAGLRSRAAVHEAYLSESLWNAPALRDWPMSVVCLYDVAELDEDAQHQMRRSHPCLRGDEADNPVYEPQLAERLFAAPLPDPPPEAIAREVDAGELASAREFLRDFARRRDLLFDRREDLVLAAHEVVTNSVLHGGGTCRLAVWEDDGVVCDVRDSGVLTDPLVGRRPPSPTAPGGRGLWLVNRLCDLVQIRSSQAGTVVRLYVGA